MRLGLWLLVVVLPSGGCDWRAEVCGPACGRFVECSPAATGRSANQTCEWADRDAALAACAESCGEAAAYGVRAYSEERTLAEALRCYQGIACADFNLADARFDGTLDGGHCPLMHDFSNEMQAAMKSRAGAFATTCKP